jgi:hypothetical protein
VVDGQPVAVVVGHGAGGGPTGSDLAAADDQGDLNFLALSSLNAADIRRRSGLPGP